MMGTINILRKMVQRQTKRYPRILGKGKLRDKKREKKKKEREKKRCRRENKKDKDGRKKRWK